MLFCEKKKLNFDKNKKTVEINAKNSELSNKVSDLQTKINELEAQKNESSAKSQEIYTKYVQLHNLVSPAKPIGAGPAPYLLSQQQQPQQMSPQQQMLLKRASTSSNLLANMTAENFTASNNPPLIQMPRSPPKVSERDITQPNPLAKSMYILPNKSTASIPVDMIAVPKQSSAEAEARANSAMPRQLNKQKTMSSFNLKDSASFEPLRTPQAGLLEVPKPMLTRQLSASAFNLQKKFADEISISDSESDSEATKTETSVPIKARPVLVRQSSQPEFPDTFKLDSLVLTNTSFVKFVRKLVEDVVGTKKKWKLSEIFFLSFFFHKIVCFSI